MSTGTSDEFGTPYADPFPELNRSANARQVGGGHYGALTAVYQHWDLTADTGMGYFEGQITKYVARWRRKNGAQDVEKALHYCDKLVELTEQRRQPLERYPTAGALDRFKQFAAQQQLTRTEELIFELCISHTTRYDLTRMQLAIGSLLEEAYAAVKS